MRYLRDHERSRGGPDRLGRTRRMVRPGAIAAALALTVSVATVSAASGAAGAAQTFLGGVTTMQHGRVDGARRRATSTRTGSRWSRPASDGWSRATCWSATSTTGSNLQGTGTTIVEVSPGGVRTVFARIDRARMAAARACGGVGLTTALAVFAAGWVVVGSLPTTDGTAATATAGLPVRARQLRARSRSVIHDKMINGPWDMTAVDHGTGPCCSSPTSSTARSRPAGKVVNRGTVVRIDALPRHDDHAPRVLGETIIGSGFAERTDPGALVVGPTGVALAGDRDALRRRHRRQPDRRDPRRARPPAQCARRCRRHRQRRPHEPARPRRSRPTATSSPSTPGRQHRRNDPTRHPGRDEDPSTAAAHPPVPVPSSASPSRPT